MDKTLPHQSQKLRGWVASMAMLAQPWLQAESCRIESRGKPQKLFSICAELFSAHLNASVSIPEAHHCIGPSSAQPHKKVAARKVSVSTIPEAAGIRKLGPLAACVRLSIAEP